MKFRFGLRRREPEAKAAVAGYATATPALAEVLGLFDGTSASFGSVYRKVAPVRTVIDFLADAVASTPLKFYRRTQDGRPEERDHPAAQLLRDPYPDLTTRRLIWGTVADLAIYGNAYWRIIQSRNGINLLPLPPFRVTPRGGEWVAPSAYDYWPPDGTTPPPIPGREMVHFRFYDPEDRRIGASKLQALRTIVDEEVEASKNRRGFWANATRTGGWIEYPLEAGSLTEDQFTRIRESLQGQYAGANNSGRTGILELGGHFNGDGFSPHDSEFIEGREFVLEATARVFNVPLPLLGLSDTATYASQREHHKSLYMETLPPWYELISSEIEAQLFPWFVDTEDLYPEFKAESKLQGDFIDKAAVLNTAVGRPWMVVREARLLENLPDRGESSDDEMAIPVGPNLALEGMAENFPAPGTAPLAAVASLPGERTRRALVDFFEHQERSVMARLGAGGGFETKRWNRALTPLIGADLAERVNLQTAIALQHEDPRAVFAEAKAVRTHQIVAELAEAAG